MLLNIGNVYCLCTGSVAYCSFAKVTTSGSTPARLDARKLPVRPDAALHLVRDEEDAALGAELRREPEVIVAQGDHPALALYRLEDERAAFRAERRVEGRSVLGLDVGEAGGKGSELLVELVLAGGGQGGDRAAVEGAAQGDDRGPRRRGWRPRACALS